MSDDAAYHRLAFRAFADFSGTIAIPAVLAGVIGEWIDVRFGTEPFGVIICLLLAFFLTVLFLLKKARLYGKEYNRLVTAEDSSKPRS